MRENVSCNGKTPGANAGADACPEVDASPNPDAEVVCKGVRVVVIALIIPS